MATKTKSERNRIFILNEPNAPRLSPALATEIGLTESVLLLQFEFWIAISQHERDGEMWTYQSLSDIHETFPFWSLSTINRAIRHLVEMELLTVGNFNHSSYDHTRWFALNKAGLARLRSVRLVDDAEQGMENPSAELTNPDGFVKLTNRSDQNETTIPETTTETTTEREHDKSSQAQEQMNPSLSLDRDNVTCADATQPSRSSLAEDEDNRNTQTSRIQTDGVTDDVVSSLPRGSPGALFDEIMTVCQHSEHTITPMIAKHILEAGNRLAAQGATSDDVRLFAEYWRTCDWRGKKGDPIEPRNIIAEWRRFTEWRDRRAIVAEWDGWIERRMPMPT